MSVRWAVGGAVVVLASCGLGVVGTPHDGATDGGATDGATLDGATPPPPPLPPAPPPPPDASGTFCERTRATDATVKRCWDFDVATQTAAPYDFDTINSAVTGSSFTLGPSPVGDGNALTIAFPSSAGTSRDVRGVKDVITPIVGQQRIEVDADLVVHDDSVSVDLLSIDTLGVGCGHYLGVGASGAQFFSITNPAANLALIANATYHVTLDLTITPGAGGSYEILVNGQGLESGTVFYEASCNHAEISLGAFFSGVASGAASVTFDRVVVRLL